MTLVTCTLGEEGEVIGPDLQLLVTAEADQLGGYRMAERAAACAALGMTDHRYLGGGGRGVPPRRGPRAPRRGR